MKYVIVVVVTLLCSWFLGLNDVTQSLWYDFLVHRLVNQMTLDEKIGQMTQVDQRFVTAEDITTYFIGSVLSGGGSRPVSGNSAKDWLDRTNELQQAALNTRLGIPLIYGVDAVHGHHNVYGATIFPHHIGLGATRNADLIRAISRATAKEVAATGIHWNFGPSVSVPQDFRWGRFYEGFSNRTKIVAELGQASVLGFQEEGVLACAKHFVGDGATVWDALSEKKMDRGNVEESAAMIRKKYFPPYERAIDAGVGSIMISFNSIENIKCHGSYTVITDWLKHELGFTGIVVSDWQGIDEIPGDYQSDIILGINAGLDMIMVPGAVIWGGKDFRTFISLLKQAVLDGQIAMSRIDDAVTRILKVKYKFGLFHHPLSSEESLSLIGSDAHRLLARQAVRESVVLLKNEASILPLSSSLSHIHVIGTGADDIGFQSGGWTIEWQGQRGNITKGTTILEAIQQELSADTRLTFGTNEDDIQAASLVIAVVGENPYAEYEGDVLKPSLSEEDITNLELLTRFDKDVVVLMISGRPLLVHDYLQDWSAFLAAWLPGTEAAGITDILFGHYFPTGKLSVDWPSDYLQQDSLFPFGFGLSYE